MPENYDSGPTRNRKLTDCTFCILMIGFWVFCVWVSIYALNNGKIEKLTMVMDDNDTPCG